VEAGFTIPRVGAENEKKKNVRAELPVDHVRLLNARLVKNQHFAIHLAYWCGKPSTYTVRTFSAGEE